MKFSVRLAAIAHDVELIVIFGGLIGGTISRVLPELAAICLDSLVRRGLPSWLCSWAGFTLRVLMPSNEWRKEGKLQVRPTAPPDQARERMNSTRKTPSDGTNFAGNPA